MREPDVEAAKPEESKESEAMESYISARVLNVGAGAAGGVSEPAVAIDASMRTARNAESVGRAMR